MITEVHFGCTAALKNSNCDYCKYYLLNITQCNVLIIRKSETSYKMSPNNLRLLMSLNSYG